MFFQSAQLQWPSAEVHSYGLTLRTPVGRGLLYVTELDEYVEARDSIDSMVGIGFTASDI